MTDKTAWTAWPQLLDVKVDFVDTDTGMAGTIDIDLNHRILDAALVASLCTMGDCHERINETTGLCAYKIHGFLKRKYGRQKSTSKYCKNGPKCMYNHTHLRTPKALEFTTALPTSRGHERRRRRQPPPVAAPTLAARRRRQYKKPLAPYTLRPEGPRLATGRLLRQTRCRGGTRTSLSMHLSPRPTMHKGGTYSVTCQTEGSGRGHVYHLPRRHKSANPTRPCPICNGARSCS